MRSLTTFLSLISLCFILNSCSDRNKESVQVEEAVKRDIVEMVSANGKIQPETDIKISPEVSGKILEIHVKEGDRVSEGDLLLTLNPDLLEANQARASASLNSARANLANARARLAQAEAQFFNVDRSYARSQQLFNDGVISQAEMDQAESNYRSALAEKQAAEETVAASRYSVRSAEATLSEASDNLERTSIFAPKDGIITALQVEEGETVLGTIQMAGTEVMRVSDLSLMEVDVEVNESDIVRVNLGDTAEVEVDAYQDKTFLGVVTEIANAATNASGILSTDQVTNFSVKIRILPSSYMDLVNEKDSMISPFRTGMSATVDIRTARKDQVLAIPIEAVTTRTDTVSGGSFREKMKRRKELEENQEEMEPMECVFILDGGEAELRVVETGIQDNRYIEIKEGVSEGEQIITGPYATVSRSLEDGDEVKVEEEDEEEED
ncbi:MAG: efflux RND transporter periplasmic adaptor subunit [Flavobacteriales bacterium]|nr:efflux RND transporter periplasmic adaptor subunit [Flavobacteriales bacterium]